MKKKWIYFRLFILATLCMISCFGTVFGQNKKIRIVNIPSTVLDSLAQYIKIMEDTKSLQRNITVVNMLSAQTSFVKGTYFFSRMASHSSPRVFVYDGKEIFIIKDDSVEGIIIELNRFFKERNISKIEKVFYLKGVFKFVEGNISFLE